MAIRIVRLGSPRLPGEGSRLGTVRRPPRGVPKGEYAKRNYYDAWLPELAPSAPLVALASKKPLTKARWDTFAKRYARELRRPEPQRLLQLLALLSKSTDFSVGCYCEDESHCHRALLRQHLVETGAKVLGNPATG
jgi:uncharacterized protein YeaO (DUF488 family)